MSSTLHLEGSMKLIYAMIFGFWINKEKSVCVPYSVIRKITGLSDPIISAGIKRLEKEGLITAKHDHGRRTRYDVVITDEIKAAYLRDTGADESTKVSKVLKQYKQSTKVCEKTASPVEAHKYNKYIKKGGKPISSNLRTEYTCTVPKIKTINKK